MVKTKVKTKRETIRVNGKLREIVTVRDAKGNILQRVVNPLMVEFYPRDIFQVLVGATILAVPVGFTEEVWMLSEVLSLSRIIGILILSLLFIGSFVFYNFYRTRFKEHSFEFFKRVFSVYLISFCVVAAFMWLIDKAVWNVDALLAFKQVVLVTFPASMSAAVADMVK